MRYFDTGYPFFPQKILQRQLDGHPSGRTLVRLKDRIYSWAFATPKKPNGINTENLSERDEAVNRAARAM
jgi:hypothetical protein